MAIYQQTATFDPVAPGDTIDHEFLFDMIPDGDTISSAAADVTPSGLNLSALSYADQTVIVWVSGGAAGVTYTITVSVITAAGRVYNRSANLPVQSLVY